MRKLNLFLILSLLTFVTPAFALDDTTLDNVIRLQGDGARQGSAVRVLKLVRNEVNIEDGVGILSSDALTLSLISDDGVSVRRTSVSQDGAFVGIAAMTIQSSDRTSATSAFDDVGGRNWGWMIVHGPANARIASGAGPGFAAGDSFITSGDAASIGQLQTVAAGTTMLGSNLNEARNSASRTGGFVLDAGGATDTSIEVYVQAL